LQLGIAYRQLRKNLLSLLMISLAAQHRALAISLPLLLLLAGLPALAPAQSPPPVSSAPYPGTITLRVDATDLDHRVMRVQQTLPVRAANNVQPLSLFFPRWLPGNHAPNGDVSRLAGLKINARSAKGEQTLAWQRDPLDTHRFQLQLPAATSALEMQFEYLSPVSSKSSGRVVMTREMLNVQWNNLVLYPAGFEARNIPVNANLRLPTGWNYGTALRPTSNVNQDGVQFETVSLETLVDSPVFAGRHLRQYALDASGTARPVALTVVADTAEQLKASDAQIEAHRELVRQADKLFGSRHFAHYDFLLALSDQQSGIGLEHHQSSENGVKPNYFEDWDKRVGSRELLPHEYVHSWNGKFRRPADLNTPHFNVPMQNSLLWLYEGQTQFWGWVLAARSGLVTVAQSRDELAQNAASLDQRIGRTWRNLQDTTHDAVMSTRGRDKDWRSWQRGSGDYYGEALLIWLDADSLIREKTNNAKSMDDFARAFFAIRDGELGPVTYRFEDIVSSLNAVLPFDWAAFLRKRLDSNNAGAPLDGLKRSGWQLVFRDKPSEQYKAEEAEDKVADFSYSIGLRVDNDGKVSGVQWDSPAFKAGLAPGVTLLAVNQRAYKAELMKSAITANKEDPAGNSGQAQELELLVKDADLFRTVKINYRGGLRYPHLERLPNTEDRLSALHTPR
jgi:predicted metalloprotease with PDZ domain